MRTVKLGTISATYVDEAVTGTLSIKPIYRGDENFLDIQVINTSVVDGEAWDYDIFGSLAGTTATRFSLSDGNADKAIVADIHSYPLIEVDAIVTAGVGTHTFDVYGAYHE